MYILILKEPIEGSKQVEVTGCVLSDGYIGFMLYGEPRLIPTSQLDSIIVKPE
jgi:hypothetical protein